MKKIMKWKWKIMNNENNEVMKNENNVNEIM